jgi:hypothetical protein
MIKLLRLTVSILLLAGVAAAFGRYEPINTADFSAHPETYDGRLVEVRADIIAIGADSKSLQLFDAQSRMMIEVRLMQLSKAQRSALMHSPVRHLLVHGQATVIGGRLIIDAHKVEALPLEAKTNRQQSSGEVGGGN